MIAKSGSWTTTISARGQDLRPVMQIKAAFAASLCPAKRTALIGIFYAVWSHRLAVRT